MIFRQQMVPLSEWSPVVRLWYGAWREWCDGIGHQDFTGWLEDALKYHSLPSQHVIFVDEAQDHTPLQLTVIRNWNSRIRVLIGDDDQNLYEWSGAIPKAFYSPPLPGDQERVLEQSYRVPRRVHAEATRWISNARDRRDKIYLPRDAEGDVSSTVYSLIDAKRGILPPFGGGRTMILASCSYMLKDIVELLKASGLPFHNPYRTGNRFWNPLATVGPIIDAYTAPEWTGDQVATWVKVLKSESTFLQGKQAEIMEQATALGEEIFPLEDLRAVMLEQQFNRAVDRDLGLFREFRKAGQSPNWDYALRAYAVHSDVHKPNLIVGTIHSVKGGEADDVILFPDLSPAGFNDMLSWGGGDRFRRLFYVGMTRARERLILGSPSRKQSVRWR
jgi:superfamily I DNA/RNA helicase